MRISNIVLFIIMMKKICLDVLFVIIIKEKLEEGTTIDIQRIYIEFYIFNIKKLGI
jgi:hypothetical protein